MKDFIVKWYEVREVSSFVEAESEESLREKLDSGDYLVLYQDMEAISSEVAWEVDTANINKYEIEETEEDWFN